MNNYDVVIVPTEAIPMWWPQLEALLLKCPETWQEYETLESIYGALIVGAGHLTVVLEKGTTKVVFAAIFQIRNYTQVRVLDIHWASGSNISEYTDLFVTSIEEFARKLNIANIDMSYVRMGFAKVLKDFGYTAEKVVLRKRLETRTIQ